MSDWKPGDVAVVKGAREAGGVRAVWQGSQWATEIGTYLNHWQVDARPLVVIDPEDAEQIKRLAKLLWPHYSDVESARLCKSEITADALREFARPTPRIEEPTGLGAVVEDDEGQRWIREAECSPGLAAWRRPAAQGLFRVWADITAVRILSEGVPS